MTDFIEFERKFLLKPAMLAAVLARACSVQVMQQGYFMENENRCVRVRRAGDDFILTFKTSTGEVGKAKEVELSVDPEKGQELLAQCTTGVHKTRHCVQDGEFLWEIDVFAGHNTGLVLAEVELASDAASDRLSAQLPEWVEREVTGQAEYFNTSLARVPTAGAQSQELSTMTYDRLFVDDYVYNGKIATQLNAMGLCSKTVCPECHVDDFCHVEDCSKLDLVADI